MSEDSHALAQIQQKEVEMKKMLEKEEKKNNERVVSAMESGASLLTEAEAEARTEVQGRLSEIKVEAKKVYVDELAAVKNHGRDVVEAGKGNVGKATVHVKKAFMTLFS
jgi:vacuolar-type H+-ATPase subunit H